MESNERLLTGHTDLEKGAYLGAIASLATADREASEEELDYLRALSEAAHLSPQQTDYVIQAAVEPAGEKLDQCLDVLKNSELRFSLVADLIAFGKADQNYSEAEQESVQRMAQYLGLSSKQFNLLDRFATEAQPATTEENNAPAVALSSSGLEEKMQHAGINTGSLLKGLIGIAGPLILSRMLNRGGRGGGFGLPGGLGGGGGLGSIIGMLNGGRGFGSLGGILGKVLGAGTR